MHDERCRCRYCYERRAVRRWARRQRLITRAERHAPLVLLCAAILTVAFLEWATRVR